MPSHSSACLTGGAMGVWGLFLAVHLLLAFSTFYSIILFILEAHCHHLRAARAGFRCRAVHRVLKVQPPEWSTATLGGAPCGPLLMEIASFADSDKTGQTNTAQAIELVFLLWTWIAWSLQSSIHRPNFQYWIWSRHKQVWVPEQVCSCCGIIGWTEVLSTVIVFKHKFQKDCFPSLELPFSDVKRFPTEPNTVVWFFRTTVPITHTTQRWQGKASCLTLFCQFSADGGCGCARFLQRGPGRGKQTPQQIAYVSLRRLQLKYKTSSVSLAFSLRVLAGNRPAPWYFFLLDKISQILYIR